MVMSEPNTLDKDTRSSVTIRLPATYADFVIGLLRKELDDADRAGQASRTAAIRDILEPFRTAMELEERQRTLREPAAPLTPADSS